jgi:hypothetical protein
VLAVTGGLVLRDRTAGYAAAGAAVHTGYGDVRVEHAEAVRGLDPHDLGGAAHGIAGLVQREQELVQVTVMVTGTGSGKAVDATRFRLRAGGQPIAPATSSLATGKLPAGASVEGTLGFVAAVSAKNLRLSVPDGDRAVDVPIRAAIVDGSPTGDDTSLNIDPFATAEPTPDTHQHDSGAGSTGDPVNNDDPTADATSTSAPGDQGSGSTSHTGASKDNLPTGAGDDTVKVK